MSEEGEHFPDGEAAYGVDGGCASTNGHVNDGGDVHDDMLGGHDHSNLDVRHSCESSEGKVDAPHGHADTDTNERDEGGDSPGEGGGSPGGLFWGASPAKHSASDPETSEDSVEEFLQCSDSQSDTYTSDGGGECSEDFSPRVVDELVHSRMGGYKVTFLNNGRPYVFERHSPVVEGLRDGKEADDDHVRAVPSRIEEDSEEDLNAWRMRDTESSDEEDEGVGEERDSIDDRR